MTNMKTIKVVELKGAALNWAVASAKGLPVLIKNRQVWLDDDVLFIPSLYWGQGGPIKSNAKIETRWIITDSEGGGYWQAANLFKDKYGYHHETSELIAAMRCYVASKLGDTVEVPEDLIK